MITALMVGGLVSCADGEQASSTTQDQTTVAAKDETTTTSTDETSATTSPLVVTDYEGGATYLTGRIESFNIDEGSLETDADGVQHSRDGTVSYQLVTDDPRVTGTVTGTWNTDRWGDLYDGAMTQWGTATLTNENGTWEGDYAGGFASPVGDIITRWWTGTGEYEGLTFYMWVAGSEPGVPIFDIGGIIVPGDPPPTVTP
jgi:hypothetical protein